MQVTEESVNGLEHKIKIQVPSADIDSAVNKKLQSLAKEARLNGFRPGKVPMQVIRKRYGGQVRQEVCLLYTSPSPRDATLSRMPSSA